MRYTRASYNLATQELTFFDGSEGTAVVPVATENEAIRYAGIISPELVLEVKTETEFNLLKSCGKFGK